MLNLHIAPLSSVQVFRFCYNHEIHEAAFYEDQVLKLAGVFLSDQRQEAIALAGRLSHNHYTLLTANANLYKIWVERKCHESFDTSIMKFYSA
ncbi:hypothetical protein [Leptolyngbya sp. PCC 6406]|uniref:hypothetical protein n=1 Tax=Leptolyngbya sp. PCC 6406 TaxID=1173264 RepID=UPI0002ABF7BB|nr:hypothetical protein [Leptolyngbya sp. PCC 6406]